MTLTLSRKGPEIGVIRDVLEAQLSFSTGRCESTALLRSLCGAGLASCGGRARRKSTHTAFGPSSPAYELPSSCQISHELVLPFLSMRMQQERQSSLRTSSALNLLQLGKNSVVRSG